MKKNKLHIFLFFFFVFSHILFSQNPLPFTVKKTGEIFFFQKGVKTDTISASKGNLFYLIVPDSLKPVISISVENGQLLPTSNDSIVKLNYLGGLKYELLFEKTPLPAGTMPQRKKYKDKASIPQPKYIAKSLINGTSSFEAGKILIRINNRKAEKIILENVYYSVN